jgi:hypothetical protein
LKLNLLSVEVEVVPEGLSILLGSNATGKFFAQEGNFYIGHYLVHTYSEMAVLPYNCHLTEDVTAEFPELVHEDFDETMMPYAGR